MSLSSAEIDRVLGEFPPGPWYVGSVHATSYHRYLIRFEGLGSAVCLSVVLQSPFLRVAILPPRPTGRGPVHRFLASLRRHLTAARLVAWEHWQGERIVRFVMERDGQEWHLYLRLWTNAANLFLCAPDRTILDAAFLRPKRGEVAGQTLRLPEPSTHPRAAPREFPGEGTYSERLERHYRDLEFRHRLEEATARLQTWLTGTINGLVSRIQTLEDQLQDTGSRDRHFGDLLMANLHRIVPFQRDITIEDWEGGTVTLALDPRLPPSRQADRFYERARKLKERSERCREEIESCRARLLQWEEVRRRLIEQPGPWVLEEAAKLRQWRSPERSESAMGLRLHIRGFPVLVGRNARENDLLLRTAAKGRDHWIHTRDVPGGFVFVRCPARKSVPLDVLLDAAQLAAHFSKARGRGKVDLYWTRVKYLRRVKDGGTGRVIPTQERNLTIETDPERVRRLLGGMNLGT